MRPCHHTSTENDSTPMSPDEGSFQNYNFTPSPPPHHQHQCVATLRSQSSYTTSLLLSGNYLLTGSSDEQIHLFKHTSLISLATAMAGKGAVKSLVVTADEIIISAHQDCKIRVWKIKDHDKFTQLATLPTLSDRVLKILTLRNHVWIRKKKKPTWFHHVDSVSALALSSNESLLYSVSWDRTLKIWRTKDFKCLESVANAHDDAINAVALPGDDFIYTGSSDRKIKVWKKNPGENKHSLVATLEKHNSGVNALALSKDGLALFSGGCDKTILVWTATGGGGGMVAVGEFQGHTKAVLCLAVVSNLVCSGSADKTVRIWRWIGGLHSCLAVLEGHQGPVKCVAAAIEPVSGESGAAETCLLYSASLDCHIKAWKIFIPVA